MKRCSYSASALLGVLLVQVGCSSSVLQLRDQLSLHRGEFRQKLTDKQELTTKFLACTRHAHDEPLSGRRDLSTLPDPLSRLIPEGQGRSVRPLADVVDALAIDANARIDLDKLKQIVEVATQWHWALDLDEDRLERDSSRFARMLLAYNKAYFGDLSFTVMPNSPGAEVRGVVKVISNGFIDRSGNAFLFPGISAEIEADVGYAVRVSTTSVDSPRISAGLMRIFLEAFFDTAYRVPAVHGSTALRVESNAQDLPFPEFDAKHPHISLEALARVTRDALRAEAVVTSIVGKAVRGGSMFGTQNETLAATLKTAAGVIAKKLAEMKGFVISRSHRDHRYRTRYESLRPSMQ